MFCAFHKGRLAHEKCSRCQAPICSDCQHVLNGKIFCPRCLPADIENRNGVRLRNPVWAALLSIFPGLGQVYNGQLLKAFVIFVTCWLIVPWFYGIYDAYVTAQRINDFAVDSDPSPVLMAGCLLVIVLSFGIFWGGPLVILKMLPDMIKQVFNLAPEQQVKLVFSDVNRAMKNYFTDYGAYPEDEARLHFAEIPYLDEMYCNTVKGEYFYKCDFRMEGYEITAIPRKNNLPAYRMKTGGQVERLQ